MSEQNGVDLDIKYRPSRLEDVVGQPEAVASIRAFGTHFPRAVMMHGPSGTGKTTIARILARMQNISELDLIEKNCGAVESAIDMVREINQQMTAAAWHDKRMWILDEVQCLSKAKHAQEALLKVLEDCPPHVCFVICTTDPQRLLAAIKGRCVKIGLKALSEKDVSSLVIDVAGREKIAVTPKLVEAVTKAANGSARDALKELQKAAGFATPDEALASVGNTGVARAAFDLVKELLPWDGAPSWAGVAKVLTDIKDEDPEGIRQMVLASARTMLLKKKHHLAYKAIICLRDPLYDRNSGHAILAACCYEICFAK